jgi:hypothetical protein
MSIAFNVSAGWCSLDHAGFTSQGFQVSSGEREDRAHSAMSEAIPEDVDKKESYRSRTRVVGGQALVKVEDEPARWRWRAMG